MVDVVYKYMPFREEFFDNRWLRFTQRAYLNDPFEVRPSFSEHAEYVHTVNKYGESVESVVAEMERNQYLVLAGIAIQDFDMYGILSLTERDDNLLMWSHYAAQHEGLVIGLDPFHDFFDGTKSDNEHIKNQVNDYIGVLKSVRYSSKRKMKSFDINEYFFLKSNDWWTEREYRYVLPISEADEIDTTDKGNTKAYYQVPADAILSVTFGMRVAKVDVRKICEKLKSNKYYMHIETFQAKMCNEEFEMKIEKVSSVSDPVNNSV